jgi:hypothetical protein
MLSAVVIVRRQAGQRCGLLAADAAELGHANDEREGGALAEAGDAEEFKFEAQLYAGPRRPVVRDPCRLALASAPVIRSSNSSVISACRA